MPYESILKLVAIAVIGVISLVGFNSCQTLIGNFWTERDNAIKKEIAHDLNAEYQKARIEEFKLFMESQKQLANEMREIYSAQDREKRDADKEYQKEINRDIEGRLDELDADLKDATMRMQRATERVLLEEERLSDWSTVTAD